MHTHTHTHPLMKEGFIKVRPRPINWAFLRRSARTPTINTIRGTRAIKGLRASKRGLVPVTGPSVPLQALSAPYRGRFNRLIVECRSQSLGCNCMGPRVASKSLGFGQT